MFNVISEKNETQEAYQVTRFQSKHFVLSMVGLG